MRETGTGGSCYRCDPVQTQLIPGFTGQWEALRKWLRIEKEMADGPLAAKQLQTARK